MTNIFTKEHVAALDRAIAQKRANPAMEFITNNFGDAVPVVTVTDTTVAAAIAAAVGADAKPADPASLSGKVPKGGYSLEELIKARDHALTNS
jgi:hypothetical protein